MKEITFTDLKKMALGDIREGPCLKIAGDGWNGPTLYVIPKVEGPMNVRVAAICSQIEAGSGSVPDKVGPTPVSVLVENYQNGDVADPQEALKHLLALGVDPDELGGLDSEEV